MSAFISCVPTGVQRPNIDPPAMAPYRCGLNALSHTYNLYFVACADCVKVFQPKYPSQALQESPALTVYAPPSGSNLSGYLDVNLPHCINRVHVDYLGREEILLSAHDNGDVYGYYVSAIQAEIDFRSGNASSQAWGNVKPFFHRNVGKSAWGLAVHREARLIAISANTHEVTVVAFELTEPSALNSDTDDSARPSRVITLKATDNIPSISFDNNGTDPSGRWLLSSSINGGTSLWELDHPEYPVQQMIAIYCKQNGCLSGETTTPSYNDFFGMQRLSARCPLGSYAHGSWNAFFVDPRSCHKGQTQQEAFGGAPVHPGRPTWDTTATKPDRAERYESALDDLFSGVQQVFSGMESYCAVGQRPPDTPPTDTPGEAEFATPPITVISKQQVTLFQPCPSGNGNTPPGGEPMITMIAPLHRTNLALGIPLDILRHCLYVPELGIFVVASPTGRCGVFSLTGTDTEYRGRPKFVYGFRQEYLLPLDEQEFEDFWYPSNDSMGNQLMGIAVGPVQGSLDCNEGDSSGNGQSMGPRKWRLLLHYSDHTVCSYELGVGPKDGDGPKFADLIV